MKELIVAAVILITGFVAGDVMLNHSIEDPTPIVHKQTHKPIYSIVCDWPLCYEKETGYVDVSTDMGRTIH